jgi:hypothetical protein
LRLLMLSILARRHVPRQSSHSCSRIRPSFRTYADESGNRDETDGGDDSNDGKKGSSVKKAVFVPTKIGFGDEAPRMPHVLALPVISRPLFPLYLVGAQS